jgi:exodeoxyribonuclease VII large subunit
MNDTVSNTPELSVSDVAGALKRTVEDAFGHVRLRGEISGYRGPHSSGHVYFSLKDQNARIDAVIWKGVFSRIKFRPEDGLEVVATGRISTFPGKSSYQIVIEQMEPAGIGALMALLEERRRKFQAEGLFDAARKRPLPYLPVVIGIVTSPTGAVIRDMIHRLSDRFPREVVVWPVRVQGEGSAAEVAAAIRGFDAIGPDDPNLPRPDVLIVARGGGSLEDLWGFNDEIVVRAAAACTIPLISAIGHETDWTLLDHVADIRAPTPTAAAEMVVPVRGELLADLRGHAARLSGAVTRLQDRRRRELSHLARALPPPERALEGPRQRLDRAGLRQAAALRSRLDRLHRFISVLAGRLGARSPAAMLARDREKLRGLGGRLPGLASRHLTIDKRALQQISARLARACESRLALERRDLARRQGEFRSLADRLGRVRDRKLHEARRALGAVGSFLGSLGYKRVLARGYAVVRDADRGLIRTTGSVAQGQGLLIELADGEIAATAGTATTGASPRPQPPRSGKARPEGGGGQGTLF